MTKFYVCCLTRNHQAHVVRFVSTFEAAKKWEHQAGVDLIEMELLYAKYLLSLHWKKPRTKKDGTSTKNVHRERMFKFRRDHGFNGTETRSSAYFYGVEVEE